MTLENLDQLLKSAAQLTPSERLMLASRLIEGVRTELPARRQVIFWKDAAGMLEYPALGEDAQVYISRSRKNDDQDRKRVLHDGE